ncbi:flagellar hook-associated family protein [Roseibium sp. RKSG952]|uniref:flagellar hook-associated family protein n=1 Tax=Roseibium sp. RKSG952 TaxID=2529384 RepID=UPI0012BD1DEC|nr:flagellar hook-associated family protein [Roseibium sp. RKSG952]MTH98281.1 flagellar hook-associated family protein [Roseibium sp. RKSG952]
MKTSFISTLTLSNTARSQIMSQTATVNKLQFELASGRKADVGLDLGGRTGETVSLRSEFNFLNAIVDTNALAKARLDIEQAALTDVRSSAENLQGTLLAVRDVNGSAGSVLAEAEASLELLVSRLNTQLNGSYLFAGQNTDQPPLTPYEAGSPNKASLDTAFSTFFGVTDQDDPAVANISATDMDTFLNGGTFDALFASPDWEADWSSATDETVSTRISTREDVSTSVSANEQVFRDLAAVYTMLSELGNEQLDHETYKVVVDKASEMLGGITSDLADLQGKLGVSQERVTLASERLDIQTNLLNERINGLENVNKEETAVRLNSAITQLEVSYSISARIQQLSIMNFL